MLICLRVVERCGVMISITSKQVSPYRVVDFTYTSIYINGLCSGLVSLQHNLAEKGTILVFLLCIQTLCSRSLLLCHEDWYMQNTNRAKLRNIYQCFIKCFEDRQIFCVTNVTGTDCITRMPK